MAVVVNEKPGIKTVNTEESNRIISCAFNFCDFYPIVKTSPHMLCRYLDSFSSHSDTVCIPFFLNDFVNFLETGIHCSGSNVVGVSLDVHRKALTSYPVSLVIDKGSVKNFCSEKVGPFNIIHGDLNLEEIIVKNVVVFSYDMYEKVRDFVNKCDRSFDVVMDQYDKTIKSSNKKRRFKVKISNLNIDKTISSTSKKEALKSVLLSAWKKYKNKKYYKRKPPEYRASTYYRDKNVMNEVVIELFHNKTADASSAAGPDSSWTEGEPLSTKRDDYGGKLRDLPTASWLGRKVRFRSINEMAVDNDGIIIYDKNDVIKAKRSDGKIVRLNKNDPNLFFTIDLI